MRKAVASLLLVVPLLAACGKAAEPIIPELKGKWGAPGIIAAIERKHAAAVQQAALKPEVSSKPGQLCSVSHVTFDKRAIHVHVLGFGFSLFSIAEVKREGARLTLTSFPDKKDPAAAVKLVLSVRNGEVRFDDMLDNRGRSLRNAPVPEGDRMRGYGANTVADAMKLFLDAQPCPST